jgi:predicted dehydrogenase
MIRIAIIGLGYWGPNLLRNFTATPEVEVAAVCDLDTERLAKVCASYPSVEQLTDLDAMLERKDIDAVAIATPVSTHYPIALKALKAGKHVWVEKPLADKVADANELVNLAREKKLTLMVDHTFVYTSAVRKIKELLEAGNLGKMLYYDSVRINLGLFQHDVNVLWDLAVHDLAILDFLLSCSPTSVSAHAISHLPGQHEDMAYMICHYPGGIMAHLHLNWLSPLKIRRTIIGGDQRMLVYDDLEPSEKLKIYDRGANLRVSSPEDIRKVNVDYRMGDMWAPHLAQSEALGLAARHFVHCINTGTTPESGGDAGLRVVRVLEAANESLKNNGAMVQL